MSATILRMPENRQPQPSLNLPEPRIWDAQRLADYLGFSIHWVYKRCEKNADNPIPRIKGTRLIKFDTWSPAFQAWLIWFLDDVDTEARQ